MKERVGEVFVKQLKTSDTAATGSATLKTKERILHCKIQHAVAFVMLSDTLQLRLNLLTIYIAGHGKPTEAGISTAICSSKTFIRDLA